MNQRDRNPAVEWARFWTAHDVEGLLSLFTNDALYCDLALGHSFCGKDALRAFFQGTFVTFPDFKMTLGNAIATEESAAGEWEMSGTFAGESFGQAPTGKSFRVNGCCFMRLTHGRIREHRDYWNPLAFDEQVAI
jgi:steroid delta-isomerase-like uncharacterized protein